MTNSLARQVSQRFGSLQFSSLMLIALLQRTPVLRVLAAAESVWVGSSLGQVLKASAVVASMVGAVDTLVGATTFVMDPASPAEATVGTPFAAAFAYTGGATTVGSYSITNLPPGLSVPGSFSLGGIQTLNNIAGTITGTPTQAGEYVVSITAFDDPNLGTGEHGSAFGTYTILVEAAADSAPSITSQPSSLVVTAGQQAMFSVTATSDPAPTYQWRKDGQNINGATSATFTILAAANSDAGTYSVVVTNPVASVPSIGATLTVNAAPVAPSIITQPANRTVTAGQEVVFSVGATGTAPLTYQWRKNGQNISGATGMTYTIASTVSDDAGAYSVVVANLVNTLASTDATLTVNAATSAPTFTIQPADQIAILGAPVTFTAAATGNPEPTYQWKKNGMSIGGATNASYTIMAVTGDDAGDYAVVATNTVNAATANVAVLLVIIPPGNAVISILVE